MQNAENQQDFGADYYQRYYKDPNTRVAEPSYYQRLAQFIGAYMAYLDIPIRSILDLGCGSGTLKEPLEKQFKKASYVGVEKSSYACRQYGWENGCASTFWSAFPFDIVVCHDVLQYLDNIRAADAIENFNSLTHKVLYFSVLTHEDWHQHVDQDLTDNNVFLRKASWYRKRLAENFKNLGGGIYIHRQLDTVVYELEGEI